MTECVSITCAEAMGVTADQTERVVTVHGATRDASYLRGTRALRLEFLRKWARVEGMVLVTKIDSASDDTC